MAVIATLAANVTARTSKFQKGMAKARRSLSRFARGIPFANISVSKFAGILTGLAVGAISIWVKRTLTAIDASAKLAQSIGISTGALTALQRAAELNGVTTAEMNKGLKELTRRLGEANTGTGEAKRALDDLGLSASTLVDLSPDKAFARIADKINTLSTQADKAQAAYLLFGRQGVKLLNVLRLGSEGLALNAEQAQTLGISFDEISAAKVEMANDALGDLGRLIQGAANILTVQLSPFVTELSDRLTKAGLAGKGLGNFVREAFAGALRFIAKAADWIELLKAAFHGLQGTVSITIGTSIAVISKFAEAVVGVLNLIPGVNLEIDKSFRALGEGFMDVGLEQLGKAAKEFKKFDEGVNSRRLSAFFADVQSRRSQEAVATVAARGGPVNPSDLTPEMLAELKNITFAIASVGAVN